MSDGKGVISYEKIKSFDDLNAVPEQDRFFAKIEFYRMLMDEIISNDECERVRKFWELLLLLKLSDLNELYSFQYSIILCKIFENRAEEMMTKLPYNPRKCTSTSSLSGCTHRYFSKVVLSLPTQAEFVEVSEKTLIGGFGCVNASLDFDSKILLPKGADRKLKENLKLIYKIKNSERSIYEDKRFVPKILKMNENNQYRNAMTKLLSTGLIKRYKKIPTQREFDLMVQAIFDEDKIGHLLIVDTEFDAENASKKHLLFNEIYTLIFEKKKSPFSQQEAGFSAAQCDKA